MPTPRKLTLVGYLPAHSKPWDSLARKKVVQAALEGDVGALRVLCRIYRCRFLLVEEKLGIDLSQLPPLPGPAYRDTGLDFIQDEETYLREYKD